MGNEPPMIRVRGVTLLPCSIKIRDIYTVGPLLDGKHILFVRADVLERDMGTRLPLTSQVSYRRRDVNTDEKLAALIKRALLQLMEHEVDELLLVNREQRVDPHAPPRLKKFSLLAARRRAREGTRAPWPRECRYGRS